MSTGTCARYAVRPVDEVASTGINGGDNRRGPRLRAMAHHSICSGRRAKTGRVARGTYHLVISRASAQTDSAQIGVPLDAARAWVAGGLAGRAGQLVAATARMGNWRVC